MVTRFGLDVPVERRAVRARDAVVIDLDFPPSTNNLFANGANGRYATQGYRDWQTKAGWMLLADRPGRLAGPVRIRLEYEERSGRRDLDNLIKPVLDLLVKHQVIDGDHRTVVREISAKWAPVKGVRITIEQAIARAA